MTTAIVLASARDHRPGKDQWIAAVEIIGTRKIALWPILWPDRPLPMTRVEFDGQYVRKVTDREEAPNW